VPKSVEKSLPPVTKQLPTYTEKNISIISDEIKSKIFFFSLKRLLKKSGIVMELPAATE
jgi:hypothetical protein